ncbi:MAG TPA: hypothetical protein PLB45_03370 [Bacilli bacterium]|jgi:hypothetical protein|nr:hypothetical protein [Bacilli bacterium]HQC83892.1 hypothetical protein [Bacilli bacterium]
MEDFYDKLSKLINELKTKDIKACKSLDEVDEVTSAYEEYFSKLECVRELDPEIMMYYLSFVSMVHELNYLTVKQKALIMLSSAAICKMFKKIGTTNYDELLMLSASSADMDIEDYPFYLAVLSDKKVSSGIVSKTKDLDEQVDIAYDVTCKMDEFPDDFITADNYDDMCNSAMDVIKNYKLGNQR